MKIHTQPVEGNEAQSRRIHKAIQGRGEASRAAEHRYERRKIRESLRRLEPVPTAGTE